MLALEPDRHAKAVTPTKRKRLHAEEKPLPGDMVRLKVGSPILRRPGSFNDRLRWIRNFNDVALLLAVCDPINRGYLDWSLVITPEPVTLGWVKTSELQSCP